MDDGEKLVCYGWLALHFKFPFRRAELRYILPWWSGGCRCRERRCASKPFPICFVSRKAKKKETKKKGSPESKQGLTSNAKLTETYSSKENKTCTPICLDKVKEIQNIW
ncbi:hypothetical protein PV326_011127 [Microctonus aethiopoides]|nr:hypothetical protein PV326_011127 [Microctonus aethiopoides]